jgi:superoxide dismutase, Cu-Zn family
MMFKKTFLGVVLIVLATGCACTDSSKPSDENDPKNREIAQADIPRKGKKIKEAVAYLKPTKGNKVQGTVTFTKVPGGIRVVADIEGLSPGRHGFHIHEHGDCEGEEAAAAGAHFNPANSEHGSPDSEKRHVGDLGNLIADESGHAHYDKIDRVISFQGPNSIIGRSVIVHADEDDLTTQPAGASGAKISCGVIEAVEETTRAF